MADDVLTISHPTQLEELSAASPEQPLTLRLKLLFALKDPALLASSRNPGSKFVRDNAGNRLRPHDSEYLDIQSLGKAWRQALAACPAASVQRIVFDGALPRDLREESESVVAEELFWDRTMPHEGGIAVGTQDFINLVVSLATVFKMKSLKSGGGVGFEVEYEEDVEHDQRKIAFQGLNKILLRLSEYVR